MIDENEVTEIEIEEEVEDMASLPDDADKFSYITQGDRRVPPRLRSIGISAIVCP